MMTVKTDIEFKISKEEQRRIAISFLESLLPFESEIRYDGLKKYWFQKTYDARGDKVISFRKGAEVKEGEELIQKTIEWLRKN